MLRLLMKSSPPLEVEANAVHWITDLEIAVPAGWEVKRKNRTFLRAVETGVEVGYKRNIEVRLFKGKRYIDKITAKYYKKYIKSKYEKNLRSITSYETGDPEFIKLENGNEALVMYSRLIIGDDDLTQMHMIVSGDENHYLVTYADMAESLAEENSPSFQTAWSTMSQVIVPFTFSSSRYDRVIFAVVIGGTLLFGFAGFLYIRRKMNLSAIDNFEHDNHDNLDDELAADGQWSVEDNSYSEAEEEAPHELDDFDEIA